MTTPFNELGGPRPQPGTKLCTGYREHDTLETGEVLVSCATSDGWVAIVHCKTGKPHRLVDNLCMHDGVWRSADRATESVAEAETAQKRQRAIWRE